MKNKWLWGIVILLVLIGAGWWGLHYGKEKVEQKAHSYRLDKLILTEVAFKDGYFITGGTVKLNEALPGKDVIDIGKTKAEALLEGKLSSPTSVTVLDDFSGFRFINKVDASRFISLVRNLQTKDSLDMLVSASIPIHIPIIGDTVLTLKPQHLRVANFKFPLVKVGLPKLEKFGLKRSRVRIPLYVRNLEEADILITGLTTKTVIPGVLSSNVKQKESVKLGPFERDTLELVAETNLDHPLKTALAVAENKDVYAADITGTMDIAIVQKGKQIEIPLKIKDRQRIELMPSPEKRKELKDLHFHVGRAKS